MRARQTINHMDKIVFEKVKRGAAVNLRSK
jgi:hypothetical protein